jgi:hypothetical protein
MSEPEDETPDDPEAPASDDVEPEIDSVGEEKMRDLLRGALGREPPPPPEADVLRGVQKRLRERSRGKFYADEWSTAKQPPIGTYLVTSAIMLAIVLVTYAILHYQSGEAVEVVNTPAPVPVRIVFPKSSPPAPAPDPPASK